MSTEKYLALITSQHRKPKFESVVAAAVNPLIDVLLFLRNLNLNFDLNTAKDSQLGIIAEWVGAPNSVPNAFPIAYFGFRDQPSALPFAEQDGTDWGGFWRESGMSNSSAMQMNNTLFKKVINAKIKLNNTDCSLDSAQEIISLVTDKKFTIKDNNDMTVTFNFLNTYEDWERELVRMMFPLPAGVRLLFGGENDY